MGSHLTGPPSAREESHKILIGVISGYSDSLILKMDSLFRFIEDVMVSVFGGLNLHLGPRGDDSECAGRY